MKKYLLGFITGLMVCGITGVLAANYLYHADEISYDPKDINWNVDSVDSAIKELYSKISDANSALFDLKNTDIAKAIGADGDTFSSVINKLGSITNQGGRSFTISNTNSITIPAGFYNGQGTISTSGLIPTPTATKTITANGNNIDVTNYKSVNVNINYSAILEAAYYTVLPGKFHRILLYRANAGLWMASPNNGPLNGEYLSVNTWYNGAISNGTITVLVPGYYYDSQSNGIYWRNAGDVFRINNYTGAGIADIFVARRL